MNVSTALQQAVELLEQDHIVAPRLTAEVLLAHALRRERAYLYAHPERELTSVEQLHYGRYLHERLKRKPTQYITGRQEFHGLEFRVTPAVFIPRPETEMVVGTALDHAAGAERVVDVGTGCGCLAVTLQKTWARATVFASDVSTAALEVARENARTLDAPVRFFCGDLLDACRDRSLDLIVSNPPYIPEGSGLPAEVRDYEPSIALFGGPDGLAFYKDLLRAAPRVLRPRGWLIVEIGYDMRPKIEALPGEQWSESKTIQDLAGLDRVMMWQKKG